MSARRLQRWSGLMAMAQLSPVLLASPRPDVGCPAAASLASRPPESQLQNLESSCRTRRKNLPAKGSTQTSWARHLQAMTESLNVSLETVHHHVKPWQPGMYRSCACHIDVALRTHML